MYKKLQQFNKFILIQSMILLLYYNTTLQVENIQAHSDMGYYIVRTRDNGYKYKRLQIFKCTSSK